MKAKITPIDFAIRLASGGTQDRHGYWQPVVADVEFSVSGAQPQDVKIQGVDLSGFEIVSTQFRHRVGGRFVRVLYSQCFDEVSEVVIKNCHSNEVHIYLIIPQ